MYIEGVYMQNVQDLRSRFRYRQAAIHYYSQIILCGMFCGLETVAEIILTKQNAVL